MIQKLHVLGGLDVWPVPLGGVLRTDGFVSPPAPIDGGKGKGPPADTGKNRLRVTFAGASNLYVFGYEPGSPDTIHVFKSTDDGDTWAIQDEGNAPTITALQAVAVFTLDSSTLAVAVASEPSADQQTTTLLLFATSTDTWGSAITVESGVSLASDHVWGISLGAHSNGDAAIVTHSARVDADTSELEYFRVTQAGAIAAQETLGGSGFGGATPAVVIGSDDDVHVLFRAQESSPTRLYYAHRPDAGTFAAESALTFDGSVGDGAAYSASDALFCGRTAAGKLFALQTTTAGAKTEFISSIAIRGTTGNAAQTSLAVKGSTGHIIYAARSGGKLSRATFDGADFVDVGLVSSTSKPEVLGASILSNTLYVVYVKPSAEEASDIYTAKIALPVPPGLDETGLLFRFSALEGVTTDGGGLVEEVALAQGSETGATLYQPTSGNRPNYAGSMNGNLRFDFDGLNDRLFVGNHGDLSAYGTYTIILALEGGADDTAFSLDGPHSTAPFSRIFLRHRSDLQLGVYEYPRSAWHYVASMQDTGPHLIAVVCDPDDGPTGSLSVYELNAGTFYTLSTYGGAGDEWGNSGNGPPELPEAEVEPDPADMIVGSEPSGVYFDGYIDEIAVYGRALNATEVQTALETLDDLWGGYQ